MRKLLAVAALAFVTLGVPTAALADDTAAADALFNEGKALQDKGQMAEACPKFEASFELSKTLGTLMNVADCREQVGDLLVALDAWDRAIVLAQETNDERIEYAKKRRGELEPRVPSIGLDVNQGAEKLSIRVDGKDLPEAKWGFPVHVNAHPVKVEVLRGEEVLDTQTIEAAAGETKRLSLDLAAIAKAHPAKAKVVVEPANPAQRYAGIAVLSVGLAGLVTFGILEGAALAQRSAANENGGCVERDDASICSPRGYELVQLAGDLAEAGQWVGVAGLATAAIGLTVFLTAPSDAPAEEATKPSAMVLPFAGPDGFGLVVRGTL